jgi:hypothetical protein
LQRRHKRTEFSSQYSGTAFAFDLPADLKGQARNNRFFLAAEFPETIT